MDRTISEFVWAPTILFVMYLYVLFNSIQSILLQLTVTIDRPKSYYHKEFYFFKAIKPELCKVKYLSDKIEFKIKKAVKSKDDWESLEGKKPLTSHGRFELSW